MSAPRLVQEIQNLVLRGDAEGAIFTRPLPNGDEICIGRSSEADLQINLSEASRRHAKLRITPSGIQICDLGSTNGTFVRRERLTPGTWVDVQVAEPFAIGDRLVALHFQSDNQDCERLIRLEAFEERVRAEVASFERTLRPFGIAIFEGAEQSDWLDAITAVLLPNDVVCVLSDAAIALLLTGRTRDAVSILVSEIKACMDRRGSQPVVQCSYCPETGTTLEKLLPSAGTRAEVAETTRPPVLVQRSGVMGRVHAMVGQVAPTSTSVLVYGATGTGKEVLARSIHERSKRKNGPFVALNCAALPENLLESELFGYEKGAFTGAANAKPGQFELANGGTLFLDEIGEMPMPAQAKLLRVVEERAVLRLGGTKLAPVDVRIIAATNRDLRVQIAQGQFRADLFYRLNGLSITLPPLRERKDEIAPLVQLFAGRAAAALRKSPPVIAPEVMTLLVEYEWPGNIRELRSVVERAVLLARQGSIQAEHLPEELMPKAIFEPERFDPTQAVTTRLPLVPDCDDEKLLTPIRVQCAQSLPPPSVTSLQEGASAAPTSLADLLAAIEKHDGALKAGMLSRDLVSQALDRCGGNQTEAAKLLGVSRRTLINRIERFGIVRPRKGGNTK